MILKTKTPFAWQLTIIRIFQNELSNPYQVQNLGCSFKFLPQRLISIDETTCFAQLVSKASKNILLGYTTSNILQPPNHPTVIFGLNFSTCVQSWKKICTNLWQSAHHRGTISWLLHSIRGVRVIWSISILIWLRDWVISACIGRHVGLIFSAIGILRSNAPHSNSRTIR